MAPRVDVSSAAAANDQTRAAMIPPASLPLHNPETVSKVESLLRARDDTTRFVGLAFLKAVLDTQEMTPAAIAASTDELQAIWRAISPTFLDRLLRARQNRKIVRGEAMDMMDLAVAIIHRFVVFLTAVDDKIRGRTPALVAALTESCGDTSTMILQVLLSSVGTAAGATKLLATPDLAALVEIAPQQPMALQVLEGMWTNASTDPNGINATQESIDEIMPRLVVGFRGTDAVTLLDCVASLIPKLIPTALPRNPQWLAPLASILKQLVTSRPTTVGRTAYTTAAATLLQVYPAFSPMLFEGTWGPESKPFSYFLINLLLIDLRASFPSLLAQLNHPDYPSVARRLAAAYDVVSSFIGFLLRSLDDEEALSLPPDLLLKLRRDIAETMSLTLEYLRDRWDAATAGAAGLHPQIRAGHVEQGQPRALTWDTKLAPVTDDVLVLAAVRTLALWLREDDNDALRRESIAVDDMFVALYQHSTSPPASLDFRSPILAAWEASLQIPSGAPALLEQGGWDVLIEDLRSITLALTHFNAGAADVPLADLRRGVEVARVLVGVVDAPSTTASPDAWLLAVQLAAGIPPAATDHATSAAPAAPAAALALDLHVAALQLAAAVLSKASRDVRRAATTHGAALTGAASRLRHTQTLDEELRASVDDVMLTFESLS